MNPQASEVHSIKALPQLDPFVVEKSPNEIEGIALNF